jgi:hypothetical protein
LDLIVFRKGSEIAETQLDTRGDGRTDQREIYRSGRRIRVDLDTTGDGVPDVIQALNPDGSILRQDEDSDGDGRIDRRFENDLPVSLEDSPPVPTRWKRPDCGRFDAFWKNH